MVERVCGVPAEEFLRVARAWAENSGRERTAALVYSVGWTQHSVGAQYIRAGSIIQLLLGNIGRPGGGVIALRGHASIQGSTDVPTLFNLLPGYLVMPHAGHGDLSEYLGRIRGENQKGFWRNADAYMVSLLKEYWGEHATAENDYCFDYLPRINGDHGTYRTVMDMVDGNVFGYFLLGQNPAVGSAHGRLQRLGMANLDWLVVRDMVMIESATFWKDGPEVETGEITPETCRTEVFVFPAASHVEKAGTFTQTRTDVAVAGEGRRTAGRGPLGAVVLLPPGPHPAGEAGGFARRARPASARPLMGLRDGGRRAVGRGRLATDQRCGPDDGQGRRQLPDSEGRRQHDVRVLDLQRRVRRRGQPGGATHAARR